MLAWALVLAGGAVSMQACGYALAGRGNTLPTYIRTIAVPQIVNHSTTPDIDRVLSDAVRREFESKGRYRVQMDTGGVDAVFTATVTSVQLQPVAFSANHQASSHQIIVTANVEFRDMHENKVLWANAGFRVTDEYADTTTSTANDPTALFTQDLNARDRLAQRFAREVVTSIFEAF